MLALFGYSLIALALVLIIGRNLSRTPRLLLALVMLLLLNGPTLLALISHG